MTSRFWLILAAFAALATPVAAQTAPRTLSMSGSGEMRAAPDSATLSAGVSASAPTAAAALSANNVRMQKVLAALKAQGIADRDMQTGNFSVSPQYANAAPNEPPRLTGYQVSNQLQIRLNDVAALGPTLDRLVAAGANQVNSVNFAIRDSAALLNEARAKAVADARDKAQTYARAAGVTLGPILSISEEGGNAPRPMMAMAMRAEKFTPIMAGEESISANVSIIWVIQ